MRTSCLLNESFRRLPANARILTEDDPAAALMVEDLVHGKVQIDGDRASLTARPGEVEFHDMAIPHDFVNEISWPPNITRGAGLLDSQL